MTDDFESWRRSPTTQTFIAGLTAEKANLLVRLISTGRASSDPAVRALAAQYDILNQTILSMTVTEDPKHAEPDANEDDGPTDHDR